MDLGPLQALTDVRKRPAVFFLFGEEAIDRGAVLALHDELAGRSFEEIDLIIHSAGGSADAAYQAMTLLRLHASKVRACVPFWAKGAATLLCIGAEEITLGEHAELGPLDVQVYEEKQEGRGEYHSALDPLKELEQLESLSLGALASAMRFIAANYGMSSDDSLRHAMAFVEVTTGSLIARLDPEMIGRYGRELAVATEYGERLLSTWSRWPPKKINEVVDQLVYGYPSHEYIIDHDELSTMGFDVARFPADQLAAVSALLPAVEEVEGSFVKLLEPAPTPSIVTVSAIAEGHAGTSAGAAGAAPARAPMPADTGAEAATGDETETDEHIAAPAGALAHGPAGEHVSDPTLEPSGEHVSTLAHGPSGEPVSALAEEPSGEHRRSAWPTRRPEST